MKRGTGGYLLLSALHKTTQPSKQLLSQHSTVGQSLNTRMKMSMNNGRTTDYEWCPLNMCSAAGSKHFLVFPLIYPKGLRSSLVSGLTTGQHHEKVLGEKDKTGATIKSVQGQGHTTSKSLHLAHAKHKMYEYSGRIKHGKTSEHEMLDST